MGALIKRKWGIVFLAIQALLTIGVIGVGLYVGMIPNRYVIIVALISLMFLGYTIASQMTDHFFVIGRVISGLVCVIMAFSSFYLVTTYAAITDISNKTTEQVHEMTVIVMNDDPATVVADALDYNYGVVLTIDRTNTESMLEEIRTQNNVSVKTQEYEDAFSLVDALYTNEVQAIVFNEAYRENVTAERENFNMDTKILDNHQVTQQVEIVQEEVKSDITNTPFVMYLSGVDSLGNSDTNLLAIINPEIKQVLLVSTPRDFYIPLSVSDGVPDKLTHARSYGLDCSIETLEMLYDVKVNYYMTVSFSGLRKIIDSLGGVKVYSDYTFTADWGPSFQEGYNKVSGREALAFARQRHDLPGGDRQRGKHQMNLIKAIFKKASSPAVLENYNGLMKSLGDSFDTNMKTKQITKLIKFQISEMPEWDIVNVSANGTDSREYTYTYRSRSLSVMKPNMDTVKKIKKAIDKVLDGEKVTQKSMNKALESPSPSEGAEEGDAQG